MATSSKVFSLEGKALKLDTAEDLDAHIAALISMDDVEEVRFLGNTLGIGACKRLGEVLSSKKSLQNANFADIFTGRLLNEIPEALSHLLTQITNLPNLRTINLNDNAFGINTYAPVAAFLSSHVPLQHLYLNNNGLGPEAGIKIADALSELHAKKEAARKAGQADVPHLETVICGRNRLENGSMRAWAKTFSLHNRLREIKMVQNGIRQEGIVHLITDGLSHLSDIRVLDLQDNTFTLMGATALAKVAPDWTEVVELGVSDSLLGNKGAKTLAKALSKGKNAKLEVLRLQFNEINSKGLRALADAAKDALPVLRKLEINGNRLSEEDDVIATMTSLLEKRKDELAGDVVIEDDWGLDSLSDLEEESEDEDEDEDEEDEIEKEVLAEKLVKDEEEALEQPVIPVKDKQVDDLAKKLEKTAI